MANYIIDTNIIVSANKKAIHLSENQNLKSSSFLQDIYQNESDCISVDSFGLIFKEYFRYSNRSGQPGIGDAFAKWLWLNQYNNLFCEQVCITPLDNYHMDFLEFPHVDSLKNFDKSDKKFVAVAISSHNSPEICNSCDSDWKKYELELKKYNIKIHYII